MDIRAASGNGGGGGSLQHPDVVVVVDDATVFAPRVQTCAGVTAQLVPHRGVAVRRLDITL